MLDVKMILMLAQEVMFSDLKDKSLMTSFGRPLITGGFVKRCYTTDPGPYFTTENIHLYPELPHQENADSVLEDVR